MKARFDASFFEKLPLETALSIFSYFPFTRLNSVLFFPRNRLNTKLVPESKRTKFYEQFNYLWKKKYALHFPQHLQHVEHIYKSKVDWFSEFKKRYQIQYQNLSKVARKLFSMVKEGMFQDFYNSNSELNKAIKEELLSHKNFFDQKDLSGNTIIDWVMKIKNQQSRQYILDFFYEIQKEFYSKTINHYATLDVRRTDNQRRDLLYWAILLHQPIDEILMIVEQTQALDMNCFDNGYYINSELLSPITLALKTNNLPLVKAFLEMRPDLKDQVNAFNQTPFFWAVKLNQLESVKYFISINADWKSDYQDPNNPSNPYNGNTLLHWAIEYGSLEIVKLLLQHEPSLLNMTNDLAETPIILATKHGKKEMARFLLAQKDIDLKGSTKLDADKGFTVFHYAAASGDELLLAELLRRYTNSETLQTDTDAPLLINKEFYEALLKIAVQGAHVSRIELILKLEPKLTKSLPQLLENNEAINEYYKNTKFVKPTNFEQTMALIAFVHAKSIKNSGAIIELIKKHPVFFAKNEETLEINQWAMKEGHIALAKECIDTLFPQKFKSAQMFFRELSLKQNNKYKYSERHSAPQYILKK